MKRKLNKKKILVVSVILLLLLASSASALIDLTGTWHPAGAGGGGGNPFNQNLNTTDSPTFVTVNTGQGANELYDMNQNVQTTDDVTFNNVSITDNMTIANGANTWIMYVDANGTLVWEMKP